MKKVLIVDDSSYMRKFVKKIIEKGGTFTSFVEASEKEEAIEVFNTEKPDIVILDLNMSEVRKDGIDVLTEIININPEAVVIIISAVGYDDVKDECLALGAKSYIRKPFDTEVLLETLEEYK